MATILEFRTELRHKAARRSPPTLLASAEIIIFPGVRISRGTPVLVGKVAKPATKAKRAAKRVKAKRPPAALRDRRMELAD